MNTKNETTFTKVHDIVREGYAAIATGKKQSCCGTSSCCGSGDSPDSETALAQMVGYSTEDLAALPEGANLGLSCGNPVAIAELREGETVVDLGAGAGFDIFQAGRKVGASGHAIGVDMTPQMLSKARSLTESYQKRSGLANVEFRLGEIEHLPLADQSVDVIISNCVINLSPDKPQVYREIARVLRKGGRVAISDLALRQPLPDAVAQMAVALVGCVAGAALVHDSERWAQEAGLTDVKTVLKPRYVDAFADWKDPLYKAIQEALPADKTLGDYIVSMELSARKA